MPTKRPGDKLNTKYTEIYSLVKKYGCKHGYVTQILHVKNPTLSIKVTTPKNVSKRFYSPTLTGLSTQIFEFLIDQNLHVRD